MTDEIVVVVEGSTTPDVVVTVSPTGEGTGVPTGGTTGQSLVKTSDTSYDTEWGDSAGGGAVDSVNGQVGVVVLDAADVGADPAGTASGLLATHTADTTSVHGIADTALLETQTGAQAKVDAAVSALLGGAPSAALDTLLELGEALTDEQDAVAALTTTVAGKADTSALTAHTGDTANPHAVTKAQVGLANADNTTDASVLASAASAAAAASKSADTLTDGTTNKAFLATERTKLTGIATAATANDTDANLKARANHTGTQTMATISDAGTAATVNTGTTSGTIPLLSTGGVLPIARLASGTPDGTKFVRDDGTLAAAGAAADPRGVAGWPGAAVWATGLWYGSLMYGASAAAANAIVSRLYLTPIYLTASRSIDRLGLNETSSAGSGVTRLGVYDAHATTGLPTTVRLDAGTFSETGAAAKEITVSATLPAGLYWLAAVSASGSAFTATGTTNNPTVTGHFSLTTIFDWNYLYVAAVTAASALPDLTSTTKSANGGNAPAVMMRAA